LAILQPSDSINVEMGIGTHPNFNKLSAIKIYKSDTLILDTKEKILDAFRKDKKYNYTLKIK